MNTKDKTILEEELQKLNEFDWGVAAGISLVVITIVAFIYLIKEEGKTREEAMRIAHSIAPKIKAEVDKTQKYVVPKLISIGTDLYKELTGQGFKILYSLLKVSEYNRLEELERKSNYRLIGYIREIVYDVVRGRKIYEGYFTGTASPFRLETFLESFENKINELRNSQSQNMNDRVENILKSYTLSEVYYKIKKAIEEANEKSIDLLTKLVNVIVNEVEKSLEKRGN
jgi:hypothetical protein